MCKPDTPAGAAGCSHDVHALCFAVRSIESTDVFQPKVKWTQGSLPTFPNVLFSTRQPQLIRALLGVVSIVAKVSHAADCMIAGGDP